MKSAVALLLPALVAGHGYVNQAIIGGEEYEFYIPEQDPYMDPAPERISRPIPGNGPVEDVDSIDVQCNGYTDGGMEGSSPAPLHAAAEAGSTVTLYWTLWPESHMGPTITYMAKCPDEGCDAWEPGTEYVDQILNILDTPVNTNVGLSGSRYRRRAATALPRTGALSVPPFLAAPSLHG